MRSARLRPWFPGELVGAAIALGLWLTAGWAINPFLPSNFGDLKTVVGGQLSFVVRRAGRRTRFTVLRSSR